MIPVTAAHAAALAAIHEAAFPPGEAWDTAAMQDILAMPGAYGFRDPRGGFVLARVAAGEGEILTLAVAPSMRRQGIARALLDRAVAVSGGATLFLEVAASNGAARGLYAAFDFIECALRRNYYGPGRDAVVMRKDALCPDSEVRRICGPH